MAAAAVSSHDAGSSMPQNNLLTRPQHRLSSRSLDSDEWSEETEISAPFSGTSTARGNTLVGGVVSDKSVSPITCDACPFCDDVCDDSCCVRCAAKRELRSPCSEHHRSRFGFFGSPSPCLNPNREKHFTMCQVKRHNTIDSAWLVAGDSVYDATTYVACHPGGTQSILKKSGGAADITSDMRFHSRKAHDMLNNVKIGKLIKCPRELVLSEAQDGCAIM